MGVSSVKTLCDSLAVGGQENGMNVVWALPWDSQGSDPGPVNGQAGIHLVPLSSSHLTKGYRIPAEDWGHIGG